MSEQSLTIHLIANAHLDPVWLWDWREGLNAGLRTVRTVLDLMEEFPDLTFIRGEAAVYQHVEQYDPDAFARIRRHVHDGRWDIVGGTFVQPDTNLPATETLIRHFLHSQRYFERSFGRSARVAWAADSFGHAAGLPDVLAASGIDSFAFSRPAPEAWPLPEAAFWWIGPSGARVLAYRTPVGAYLCERDDLPRQLDQTLAAARSSKLTHIACFYGLGDHGGGPTRRHLREIEAWSRQHPQIRVLHSGLHRLTEAVRNEVAARTIELPVHRGELNFVFRGCYSSAAHLKAAYRRAEAAVTRAERLATAVGSVTGSVGPSLDGAWQQVLFNSFHDVLPGTAIARALDEQREQLGGAIDTARRVEFDAVNRLSAAIAPAPPRHGAPDDAPLPVPVLVFNPTPAEFGGFVELETCLDDRPLFAFSGRPQDVPLVVTDASGAVLPHQQVASEHRAFPALPWRLRCVVPVRVGAMGWTVLHVGVGQGADTPLGGKAAAGVGNDIFNEHWQVEARPGDRGVRVRRHGQSVFGEDGVGAVVVDDPWGTWGDMNGGGAATTGADHEAWSVADVRILERGPLRASLWVRLAGKAGRSRLDLTFHLYAGDDVVHVAARAFWDERAATLKLVLPTGATDVVCDVPGGQVHRPADAGEAPCGQWVIASGSGHAVAFASDWLCGYDVDGRGALRPTLVRGVPAASTDPWDPATEPDRPVLDAGEHTLRFVLLRDADPQRVIAAAGRLTHPLVTQLVPDGHGDLPAAGSTLEISPESLSLLAFKPAAEGDGWILRLHNRGDGASTPSCRFKTGRVQLDPLQPHEIGTWRITPDGTAARVDAIEKPIGQPT